MPILLDHLIVPSHDQVASAKFAAELLGLPWEEHRGHFSPVYVNETLTLDFANSELFESHHYCFHVSDAEFEQIFGRIQAAGLQYGSEPQRPDDMQVNTRLGGKNIYWRDADGHLWEMLTVSYARVDSPALSASIS
jgi:catechol 2,3-dioxygenase-like lactoylglutathione lyase family enzyme